MLGIGQMLMASNSGANYFGSGVDGAVTISVNTSLTSTLNGDMVVQNWTGLTITAGNTLTVSNPCRGLLGYIDGNLTVNGTLTMTARGAAVDPTASASGDGHPVNGAGITFWRNTAAGSATFVANGTYGCGTAAVAAEANQASVSGNATLFTISRAGGAGAAAVTTGSGAGISGTNAPAAGTGQSGGGGSGSGGASGAATMGNGGAGAAGTCFSGGTGGGSGGYSEAANQGVNGTAGASNGGVGGDCGATSGGRASGGGAGNPNGANNLTGTGIATSNGTGTGGLLVLIVRGNVTIGASGVISADGVQANTISNSFEMQAGGSSGGGNVLLLYGGTLSNSGSIRASGATGGFTTQRVGGNGANGSVQTAQISAL